MRQPRGLTHPGHPDANHKSTPSTDILRRCFNLRHGGREPHSSRNVGTVDVVQTKSPTVRGQCESLDVHVQYTSSNAVRALELLLTGKLEHPGRVGVSIRGIPLARLAAGSALANRESSTTKLAKFFPNATPVRIPVRLTRMGNATIALSESTVIEFGTHCEVLFASTLPLEFADKLRLRNSDGSLDTEACVVAVQYNGGRTAVAARFTGAVANWIVKP